jgi:hypothetical protein
VDLCAWACISYSSGCRGTTGTIGITPTGDGAKSWGSVLILKLSDAWTGVVGEPPSSFESQVPPFMVGPVLILRRSISLLPERCTGLLPTPSIDRSGRGDDYVSASGKINHDLCGSSWCRARFPRVLGWSRLPEDRAVGLPVERGPAANTPPVPFVRGRGRVDWFAALLGSRSTPPWSTSS